ncbi:MAG: septal ring lytic transglycosylase RlpA family protein [Spirochaetes bacterium]|nr:septal ring lytic transglycosylase RlpA family protein [Spirochaetota bacterium]
MKTSVLILALLALVACRAPQARTSVADPAQAVKTDDPVLQDGASGEDRIAAASSEGYASWYGKELQGRPTASGEAFDMNKMTAAHRDFPMNSLVLVKNIENGKKVMVKVNDRGPYVDGRVIDVSYAAARELGFAEKGVTRVQLELVQAGENNFMSKAQACAPTDADCAAKAKLKSKNSQDADEEIVEPVAMDDNAELTDEDDGKIKSVSKKEKLTFLDGRRPKGYTVQVGAFRKKVNAERHRDEILEAYPEKSFIATNGKWHFVCIGDFKSRKTAKNFLKKLNDDGVDVMYRGKVK